MATRGAVQAASPPSEALVTLDQLEAWLRAARPGDWLVYQRGPWMVHDAVTRRVGALAQAGLVNPAQPPAAERPGCRDFKAQRTSVPLPGAGTRGGAAGVAMAPPEPADDKMPELLKILRRLANVGKRCPTDTELARLVGLPTRHAVAWRMRKAEQSGAIRIDTILTGPEAGWRTVTIAASGRATEPPPSLRALKASIQREIG